MKQHFSSRVWQSLVSLIFLTSFVAAQTSQSSLVYTDATSGQRVEFTPFGTLKFQPQNLVSAAWRINYADRSGSHSAWFFNQQLNSGVIPVSLTANYPTGQVLNIGERLYVGAVMQTADGKLRITQRFIWDAGRGPINSVLTYENISKNPVDVNNVIIWRLEEPPPIHGELCPYIQPLPGMTAATSLVTILGTRYLRTVLSFTLPPLQPSQSRDVPTAGCNGSKDPV